MKLPVFTVASTIAPAERIHYLATQLFPREDHEVRERGTRVELRSRLGSIEVDAGRGGVWAADMSRLWRFDPMNDKKRELMSRADAAPTAQRLLQESAVLPEIAAPFRLREVRTTGAKSVVVRGKGGSRRIM